MNTFRCVKIFRAPYHCLGALRGLLVLIDQVVHQGREQAAVIEDTEAKRWVNKDMQEVASSRRGRFLALTASCSHLHVAARAAQALPGRSEGVVWAVDTVRAGRSSASLACKHKPWVSLPANSHALFEGRVRPASNTLLNATLAKACRPTCAMLGGVLGRMAYDALGNDQEPSPLGAEAALAMVSNKSTGVSNV